MPDSRGCFRGSLTRSRIPLWVKIAYTAFVAVLVPAYWQSTPLTFLWFCNAAVLIILAALWLESSLLASAQILAIFWPHMFWQIDFFTQVTTGAKIFHLCGLTPADYMFDPAFPAIKWYLSLQHAWLLYLLLWVLWRLGYDRRALAVQTGFAWLLLPLAFLLLTDFRGPAGNVNQVFGMSATEPQVWMPRWAWLLFLMIAIPVLHYGPLHFVLRRVLPMPRRSLISIPLWQRVALFLRPR